MERPAGATTTPRASRCWRARTEPGTSWPAASASDARYPCGDYGALCKPDAEALGWVDLRPRRKSVSFLRASKVPTVIIETPQALAPAEVLRWDEPATLDASSQAVANALVDAQPLQSASPRRVTR
jgi:hypothetical protein